MVYRFLLRDMNCNCIYIPTNKKMLKSNVMDWINHITLECKPPAPTTWYLHELILIETFFLFLSFQILLLCKYNSLQIWHVTIRWEIILLQAFRKNEKNYKVNWQFSYKYGNKIQSSFTGFPMTNGLSMNSRMRYHFFFHQLLYTAPLCDWFSTG